MACHRDRISRALLLWAALVAGTAVAAQANAAQDFVASGKLTYGTAATFAPFEYEKNGRLVGFDIDLAKLIAAKLKRQPKPFNVEFKGLIPALRGRRVDLINSAMYINAERAKQVDFIPYLRIGNEIIVKKGNPAGIHGRADACGHSIAVTLGGIEETYARQDKKRCAQQGKPAVNVMTFPSAQVAAMAVNRGRADMYYNSTPGTAYLLGEVPNTYQVAGKTFNADTRIGMAVRKNDAAMKTALQKALDAVVADGDYLKLVKRYHLPVSAAILVKH